MEGLFKKLTSSPMLKNIAKISSGTMMGQAISIVTLPIFTRIYGPSVLGIWTSLMSITMVMNSFSDLGLGNAIMIEEEGEKTKRLHAVINTDILLIGLLTSIVYFFYELYIAENAIMDAAFFSLILFVLIYTQQQVNVCYIWLNKKKQYNILMTNPLVNNLSIALIAVPLGLIGFLEYGYYLGLLAGQVITLLHMKRHLPKFEFSFNIVEHKEIYKKHIRFIKYQMPTYSIAQIKNQLPVFFIRSFFGVEILGYYSVCTRVLQIPITLLANAIGNVYYQTVSEMSRKHEAVGEFTLKSIKRAMYVAAIPITAVLAVGDVVCVLFLGNDYVISGNLVRIIVFMTFFQFLMQSTQGLTIVLQKQQYAMISAIAQIGGYAVAFTIGKFIFNDYYVACALMTILFVVIQIVYFRKLLNAADVTSKQFYLPLVGTIGTIFLITAVIRVIANCLGIVRGI